MLCFLFHSNTTGATSFLFKEYHYVGVFMVVFAILIFLFLGYVEGLDTKTQQCTYDVHRMCKLALATALLNNVSFLLGALTSVLSGFLARKVATYLNARMTLEARNSVGKAFITAFRSGAVMGSLLFGSVHWLSKSGFKESMGGLKNSSIEISGKFKDDGVDVVIVTEVFSSRRWRWSEVIVFFQWWKTVGGDGGGGGQR
ncbi:putative inorganic diphosphatase [Helianthus anomalus]